MTSSTVIRHASQWESLFRFLRTLPLETQHGKSRSWQITWSAPKRTNPQNRYLWGVVYKKFARGLTESTGQVVTPEWIHELCKQHFMPRIDVPGTGQSVPMSTTELTRSGNESSFQDYITQIQEMAAGMGIYIPDPYEETKA